MSLLSRDFILAAADFATVPVPVPEWAGGDQGAVVYVRTISSAERDQFEADGIKEEAGKKRRVDLTNLRARFAVLAACDPDGKPLFTADDVAALGKKASRPLDRIFDAGRKLNGMFPDEEADAKN